MKGGQSFNGRVSIDFSLKTKTPNYDPETDNKNCLFIDYKGKLIRSLTINGTKIGQQTENLWLNHRIYIPNLHQKVGKNSVVVEFESAYVSDCQGCQYFCDDADKSEYVYTELEPDYCHIVFPCFDQPDLKATHKSCIIAPEDWEVISNSECIKKSPAQDISSTDKEFKAALNRFEIAQDSAILSQYENNKVKVYEF